MKDDTDDLLDNLGNAPEGLVEFSIEAATPERRGRRSVRDEERLLQGLGAVFSVRRAAELLPGRDDNNRRWLREQKLIRLLDGKEVVIWAEVVQRLGAASPSDLPTPPQVRRKRRSRAALPRYGLGG